MKTLAVVLMLLVVSLWAAPKTYTIKKCPAGSAPTIDGIITEWPETYFLDTLSSEDNAYAHDGSTPWSPGEFQMRVYAAYDDKKFYFAVKVTSDDDYIIGNGWSADNLKINPGGQAMAFYINSDGTPPTLNPSSPFQYGDGLWAGTVSRGNGLLPTYEFSTWDSLFDPFEMGSFQASIGSEEVDAGNQMFFMGLGAEYKGGKQDWSGNPWDNTQYYPTFNLDMGSAENPPFSIAVENIGNARKTGFISAAPVPFTSSAVLSYSAKNSASLTVYDITGCIMKQLGVVRGHGRVAWDGKDSAGRPVSAGVYVARLQGGTDVFETRLFLAR